MPCQTPAAEHLMSVSISAGTSEMMSYYMDTAIGSAGPYPLARPGVMKQGAVGSCEDPWMTCGFQSACYQPRACYPLWDESAIQEVPTGLEHYSTDMECADVPLLTPSSKEMMSQALKATFSGFAKEQQRLGIPKDPQQWTETHVRDWVMWAVNEFSLKGVDFQKFCMNGAALCALGKECFLELAPDFVGDILWEHLEILQKEEIKPYPANGVNAAYPESRYTSDYFISYGIEHAQCVPPSEFSEPSFITESYQTLHPISSEELLSLKYENDYSSVILRDPVQTDSLQTDYFTIKQEVVTPDNMCMGRASRGKLGGQDSFESIESYDSCDRLTQSWSSQSSFQSLQRVPSYDSFDSEDYPAALPNHKPKGTFKDYVRDRADMNKDKPVIPAAALAGYTGGQAMGQEEKQAQDELREAEPWPALLLRQEHHPQDGREALRLPLRLRPAEPAGLHAGGAPHHAGRQAGCRRVKAAGWGGRRPRVILES
uniref:ETS proto-onco 1, transcription factor n=1 Tax=Anser brachyrhynchus TaxID=132585 RepID=A0A8B9CUY1_9AVES